MPEGIMASYVRDHASMNSNSTVYSVMTAAYKNQG